MRHKMRNGIHGLRKSGLLCSGFTSRKRCTLGWFLSCSLAVTANESSSLCPLCFLWLRFVVYPVAPRRS
jgi:hypothetical protein